ncbi:hypothetical protein BK778_33345 [Bacillus thuringiensis serovar aizawai]|nr:hypothetical protein BK756_32725 [Bacillus thuringiensis serovar aizawai]OUA35420.1 hypothetical protein BK778_33345 [Bacillus thuringiensis serovar aizawai]
MKTKDYKEKCMNKFNEIRLLLCGHIHKVRALYFLFIFHFSLDFSGDEQKHPSCKRCLAAMHRITSLR